jgi:hypothetical protein
LKVLVTANKSGMYKKEKHYYSIKIFNINPGYCITPRFFTGKNFATKVINQDSLHTGKSKAFIAGESFVF